MFINKYHIEGVVLFTPKVYEDDRGVFLESYSDKVFEDATGLKPNFVQDNKSISSLGVLRGLHFQNPPYDQGKLVRVTKGVAYDVIVDIRVGSKTYGEHLVIKLNNKRHQSLWIPPGFAHGFLSMSDNTVFEYKCTNIYNKESEGGLLWNDKKLNINWNSLLKDNVYIISEKDKLLPTLEEYERTINKTRNS